MSLAERPVTAPDPRYIAAMGGAEWSDRLRGRFLAFEGPDGSGKSTQIARLQAWAQERGHTILELAFAWLLGHEVVSSVIAGATTPEQVKTNAATAAWRLTPEEVDEVTKLVA